jgi:glycosyltransferase involved in cell wall biosynthesis
MLCEALTVAGVETDVFTTTANGLSELDVVANKPMVVDGVRVTYFKRLTKDHTHFSPSLLLKLWKTAKQYDAIHIHGWWNTISVLTCAIALRQKVPVIVSPRGMLSDYSFGTKNTSKKSLIHRFIGKRLLEKTFIHVTSISEQREIEKLVKPKAVTVIPNIIKLPRTVFAGPEDQGVFKIIFLSRIDPKKGLERLLEALPNLELPWHLTIAGTGDNNYIQLLKSMADNLNISEKITWAGFAGEEKFYLLSRHDLFVLPSQNENFGNAVIESLSVGTPVLISKGVGLASYVSKNKLGWACQASPQVLLETLADIILTKRDDRVQIRAKAPQLIQNDFNSAAVVQFYSNLYKQVATK